MTNPLTDLDKQILATEARMYVTSAGKERAILALGMRPTGYYLRLAELLHTPAALAHDPITVNRLLRKLDRRWAHLTENGEPA